MENHPKKADVVESPTNQLIHRITQVRSTIRGVTHLKTVSLPAEIVIKARSAKQDWEASVNLNSRVDVQPHTQKRIARRGRPHFVHRANNLGACPRRASPYKIRDALNKEAFPAERALVITQPLMIWGKTRYGRSSKFFIHQQKIHTFDTGTIHRNYERWFSNSASSWAIFQWQNIWLHTYRTHFEARNDHCRQPTCRSL